MSEWKNMQRKTKENFKDITRGVLYILGVGAGISLLAILSGGRRSDKLFKGFGKYAKWKVTQTLKQLRLRGYVKFDDDDEKSPILLTPKGMRRYLRYGLAETIAGKAKKWDYLWRMVIFDIPEKKRKSRIAFRRDLASSGFYPLQESVFVSPYKCEKEIIEIAKNYGILSHILVFTVASLGSRERGVRAYFFNKH